MGVEVGGSLEDRPSVKSGEGPPLAGLHAKRHRALATMRKYSQLKWQRLVTQSFCAWMNCSKCFERNVKEMDELPHSRGSKLSCRACRLRVNCTKSLLCLDSRRTAYLWWFSPQPFLGHPCLVGSRYM